MHTTLAHSNVKFRLQHLHAGDLFTQLLLTFAQHHFVPPEAVPRWENQIVALKISETENTLTYSLQISNMNFKT